MILIQQLQPLAYFREVPIEKHFLRCATADKRHRVLHRPEPDTDDSPFVPFVHPDNCRLHERNKQQRRNQHVGTVLVRLYVELQRMRVHLLQRKVIVQELYLRTQQHLVSVAVVELVAQQLAQPQKHVRSLPRLLHCQCPRAVQNAEQ